MLISVLVALSIALIVQQYQFLESIKYIVLGFNLDPSSPLESILRGGGIISMWKASLVVFISCSLSGIFEGTHMLKAIDNVLSRAKSRFMLLVYTTITSIFTAAFGCNQTITIVLSHHFMEKKYKENNIDNYQLAVDMENTGVVIAALIPWNIAALVPTLTMGVDSAGFIPYASYLYLLPIVNIIYLKLTEIKERKVSTQVFPNNALSKS